MNTKPRMEKQVTIEIWSDVVCPFCLLAKKKMERAIAAIHATDKVEVIWHSFQLDPSFPVNKSLPSIEYLSESKGLTIEQVTEMCNSLSSQATPYGIDFNFDKALTFNTSNVHRLIQWAKTFQLSNQLKETLMQAHFAEGIDLSKEKNIYGIAEKAGLPVDKTKEILQSDAYAKDVTADIERAKDLGIRGVPYFLINKKEVIKGAQHETVFENAISAALKESAAPASDATQGYCTPDEGCT